MPWSTLTVDSLDGDVVAFDAPCNGGFGPSRPPEEPLIQISLDGDDAD